jgi:hypothetical protein
VLSPLKRPIAYLAQGIALFLFRATPWRVFRLSQLASILLERSRLHLWSFYLFSHATEAISKSRDDGNTLVLIVNRDAKPIKEVNQPSHLPGHCAREALEFRNGYRCFPPEAVNLHTEHMQVGLKTAYRGADVEGGLHCPR